MNSIPLALACLAAVAALMLAVSRRWDLRDETTRADALAVWANAFWAGQSQRRTVRASEGPPPLPTVALTQAISLVRPLLAKPMLGRLTGFLPRFLLPGERE